jgi:mRNA interferase MazF
VVIKRGDVYYADLSPVIGSEQGGVRPVLVIQNDIGNKYSPTVIVAAITSKINKAKMPTHFELSVKDIGLSKDSVVLLEQVRTIDKRRLREKIGQISPANMYKINRARRLRELNFERLKIFPAAVFPNTRENRSLLPLLNPNERKLFEGQQPAFVLVYSRRRKEADFPPSSFYNTRCLKRKKTIPNTDKIGFFISFRSDLFSFIVLLTYSSFIPSHRQNSRIASYRFLPV